MRDKHEQERTADLAASVDAARAWLLRQFDGRVMTAGEWEFTLQRSIESEWSVDGWERIAFDADTRNTALRIQPTEYRWPGRALRFKLAELADGGARVAGECLDRRLEGAFAERWAAMLAECGGPSLAATAGDGDLDLEQFWADTAHSLSESARQAAAQLETTLAWERRARLLAAGKLPEAERAPRPAGEPRPQNAASERKAERRAALAAMLAERRRWTNKQLLAALDKAGFTCVLSTLKADKRALRQEGKKAK